MTKVKGLGQAFTKELMSLGFTENTNPFITFVKYAFAHGYNLNGTNYGAIHNSYIDELITDADLRLTSASASSGRNILVCKNLYGVSPTDIVKLFKLQQDIIKNYNMRAEGLQDIYGDDNDGKLNLVVAIMSTEINIEELGDKAPQKNLVGATLRTVAEATAAYKLCCPGAASSAEKEEETAKNISADLAKLVNQIKTAGLTRQTPSYLATKYDNGTGRLVKLAKEANGGSLVQLSENDIKNLGKIFSGYAAISEKTMQEIINALNGKAQDQAKK